MLLGDGNGTFEAPLILGAGGLGIAVGDFNRDGKPDLAVGGVTVLLNVSSTRYTATTTTLTASPNPSTYGQSVILTAVVSATGGGNPTGTVSFFFNSVPGAGATLVNGSASLTASALTPGSYSITAYYRGDSNFSASTSSAVTQIVNKTSTSTALAVSPNPSTFGQAVTITATVTSNTAVPTGTVTFYDGANVLGTANLSGNMASLSGVLLGAGSHTITGSYAGDSNLLGSTSTPLTQTVKQATTATALISSANPSYVNQAVTFTATVTSQYDGALTGHVTFKQGTTTLATVALANGQAAYSKTYTTTGTRSISAVYSGDGNNVSSASAVLNQVVNSLPAATTTKVTSSGSPSFINQPVTFTATITSTYGPIPNGETVTFYDGTAKIGTGTTTSGVAAFRTSTLTVKTHTIKATYPGDATFKASSGTVTQVVHLYPSTTSVPTSSLNPSTYGQSVTLRAAVTSTAPSTPTGTVTFKNGTTSLGSATLNASSLATLTKTGLPAGSLSITAVYNGDSQTAKSTSATLLQTVNQASTTTTVKSSLNPSLLGQSVTFTATVTSPTTTPAGSVTFLDGTNALGTVTLSGGKASYSTSTLSAGSHSITAVYNGTANIRGSTSSPLVQTVN